MFVGLVAQYVNCGYTCYIRRVAGPWNSGLWHMYGYVVIPENHVCYGKSIDQLIKLGIRVHRELTFSEMVGNEWWIGFDCPHPADIFEHMPLNEANKAYGDGSFVKQELSMLICQLMELEPKGLSW